MASEFTPAVKTLVRERAGSKCDRCGMPAPAPQFHHRRARGMGGTSRDASGLPSNCLHLHPKCHDYIESHPAESREKGWLVEQTADPALIPVWVKGQWCILNDDGTFRFLSAGATRGSVHQH